MNIITPYISAQTVDDFGLRFTQLKFSATLAAATDTQLTVPGNAHRYKAVIKTSAAGVFVANNATAAGPAGGTFASTTSELVPSNRELCREVVEGDVLHFIQTAGGAFVSVVFYALGTNN